MFTKKIQLNDVHRIKRPGVGYVYTGKITIGGLYLGLMDGDVRYSPKYQRGFRPSLQVDEGEYDRLLQIDDERLNIDRDRAASMAVKYLMAVNNVSDKMLYNPDVIWNVRTDTHRPTPNYDADKRQLEIYTTLTIPDSGHRHFAYFLLASWKNDLESIPDEIAIEVDGETVAKEQIAGWVTNFDPYDAEEASVLVEVFSISKENEGRLFDEYNDEGKKPSTALAIDMYQEKTPSRRFITRLMTTCEIFGRSEVETRTNSIGSKSRKLTTNATMASAARQFSKRLWKLEQKEPAAFDDLVAFFCSFYEEWANHFNEFLPGASYENRWALRARSFALSNIMFFPMFRLAFELWGKYRKAGAEWRTEPEWRAGLARLAGNVSIEVEDPTRPGAKRTIEVPVMARDSEDPFQVGNPAWRGKILVQQFDSEGRSRGWALSSTRQTRDNAFYYLLEMSRLTLPSKADQVLTEIG